MLSNAYFLAKFRFDTAANEPAKILQNLLILLTLILKVPPVPNGEAPDLAAFEERAAVPRGADFLAVDPEEAWLAAASGAPAKRPLPRARSSSSVVASIAKSVSN